MRPLSATSLLVGAQGGDGNLVMEYLYTDEYTLRTIEANSLAPYTCAVQDSYFHACLDIASASTLSYTGGFDDGASLVSFNGTANSHLFGSREQCDGRRVGDGVVSGYDLVVLMWYQFRVAPYSGIAFTHPTVTLHQDAGVRCDDTITRQEYLGAYDSSAPCAHPRRLQTAADAVVPFTIHRHATVGMRGTWFQIRSHGAPYAAVELLLQGVRADATVALSNVNAPLANTTEAPDDYEVRFARHDEYCAGVVSRCASVRGIVSTGVALYHNVLGIGQIPTQDRGQVCAYDVFLFVPGVLDCSVGILAGSSVMDGGDGIRFNSDVRCDDTPVYTCDASVAAVAADDATRGAANHASTVAVAVSVSLGTALLVAFLLLWLFVCRYYHISIQRAPTRVPTAESTV
jgi:hypothetical protein